MAENEKDVPIREREDGSVLAKVEMPEEIEDHEDNEKVQAADEDDRTDEDQLGMSYPELERAMDNDLLDRAHAYEILEIPLAKTEKAQLRRYREIRARNLHKMLPIPVCKFW